MRTPTTDPRRSLLALLLVVACNGSGATTGAGTTTGTTSSSTTDATTGALPTTGAPEDPSTSTSTTSDTTSTSTTSEPGTSTTSDTSTGSTGASTTDTTAAIDSSSGSSTGEGTTGEPIDCAALPQGPQPYTVKPGPRASEDLAFDDQGHLIGAKNGSLFKSTFEGPPQLWVPGAGGFIAGLRATAKGVVVYADNDSATLFRVNAGGVKEMVLGGLDYANGLEVDLDGYVYAAEQTGGRVRRIDPATGNFTILAQGLDNPNGVSFAPDYRTLYVGSFGGGTITAIALNEDMTPAGVSLFRGGIGGGALDGMAVDACGNVYVCEFGPATVWRIDADGQSHAPIVELGAETYWIPNMQWGSGIGGWDRDTLYVLDMDKERVFEVQLGVPDKPRAYP